MVIQTSPKRTFVAHARGANSGLLMYRLSLGVKSRSPDPYHALAAEHRLGYNLAFHGVGDEAHHVRLMMQLARPPLGSTGRPPAGRPGPRAGKRAAAVRLLYHQTFRFVAIVEHDDVAD